MDAPYRHIACCIDDSEAATHALAEARRLRALGQGRLSLVHVAQYPLPYSVGFGAPQPDPSDIARGASAWLESVAADVPEGEAVLLEGHPASEVCAWAEGNAVDLLICAAHHSFAHRLALGSFAHTLVNNAPCPVLVLRPAQATAS